MLEKNIKRGGLIVNIQDVRDILGLIISLSSVLGIFTGIVNKLFNKKLEPINEKIDRNHEASLKEDMRMARYNVVKFASELRRGVEKTRYEFEAVAELADTYEKAVSELGIKNSFFEEEEIYIKQKYHELCDKQK